MERREFHPSEEPRRESSPLADFAMPDISPLQPGQYEKTATVETEIKAGDLRLPCKVTFGRFEERDYKNTSSGYCSRGQLDVEAFDPETKKRVLTFKAALNYGLSQGNHAVQKDSRPHTFWHIHTRRVEAALRGKGLGTAGIQAFEDAARRAGAAEQDFEAEWIQFDTSLSSLTKLTIDQDWLGANGLLEFKKTSGPNLGYVPAPGDEERIDEVLRGKTEELEDLNENSVDVRLFKRISSE